MSKIRWIHQSQVRPFLRNLCNFSFRWRDYSSTEWNQMCLNYMNMRMRRGFSCSFIQYSNNFFAPARVHDMTGKRRRCSFHFMNSIHRELYRVHTHTHDCNLIFPSFNQKAFHRCTDFSFMSRWIVLKNEKKKHFEECKRQTCARDEIRWNFFSSDLINGEFKWCGMWIKRYHLQLIKLFSMWEGCIYYKLFIRIYSSEGQTHFNAEMLIWFDLVWFKPGWWISTCVLTNWNCIFVPWNFNSKSCYDGK